MSLTASAIVKPITQQYLGSLAHLAKTAREFCAEKNIAEDALLQDRLAPDMHPLIWQFQMISEFSARCTSRLAGVDLPEYPYEETSFAELETRIAKIQDYIASLDDAALDAGLEKNQQVQTPTGDTFDFRGPVYLNHFFIPNFYFHITTAYNILRKNGLPLGKFDFIGQMPR